jgi:catalase
MTHDPGQRPTKPPYAPNSYDGPRADPGCAGEPAWWAEAAELGRYAYERHADDDDFTQAGVLVRDVMTDTERDHLVDNIVDHLGRDVTDRTQERAIEYWTRVNGALGRRVAAGLGRERRVAA